MRGGCLQPPNGWVNAEAAERAAGFNEGGLSPAPEPDGRKELCAKYSGFNEGGLSPAPEPECCVEPSMKGGGLQ